MVLMNEKLRREVIDRDGKCKECGTTEDLCIHHIQSGGSDELSNLITICRPCHTRIHRQNIPADAISIWVRFSLPAHIHRKMKVRAILAGVPLKHYLIHIIELVSDDKLIPVEGENGEDEERNQEN